MLRRGDEKSAPSTSFLQCSLAVLITRWSSSFYSSSSCLSSVGCSAVFTEYPLLQPHDNWLPLCLQAERGTRAQKRVGKAGVSRGPIVRSASRASFSPRTNKHFHGSKPGGDSRCDFYEQTAGGVLSAQSRGPQRSRQFEPLIDSLRRWGGREWREKTRVKESSEWGVVTSNLICFRQRQTCMMKRTLCVVVQQCFWGAEFWSFCVLL